MKNLTCSPANGPYLALHLFGYHPNHYGSKTYPAFDFYLSLVFLPAREFLIAPEAMLHHAIQACAAGDKIKVGIDPVEHEDDEDTKSHPPKILSSSTAYVGRHAGE